jgi:hypothetical protein
MNRNCRRSNNNKKLNKLNIQVKDQCKMIDAKVEKDLKVCLLAFAEAEEQYHEVCAKEMKHAVHKLK